MIAHSRSLCPTVTEIMALTFVFNIDDLVSGQQQVSGLLHTEAVVLKNLAGEDDVLYNNDNIGVKQQFGNITTLDQDWFG